MRNLLNGRFGLEHSGAWTLIIVYPSHPSGGDVNTMKNALRSQDLRVFLFFHLATSITIHP